MDLISIRKRANDINLPLHVWAQLTSRGCQKIHRPELSAWLSGDSSLKADKVERLLDMLAQLEKMVAASPVKIDMRSAESIEQALNIMPELLEAQRHVAIKKNSIAPVAVSRPVWPAKSDDGIRATPEASRLLAEQ
jgi:hypothetical protein